MQTNTAIIGGGLSGLALADRLGDHDWQLFEARDRLGGRVLSLADAGTGASFDMGPAWIWPHNRRALAAAERFKLSVFEQHAIGKLVFQDQTGAIRRDLDFAPMAGSLRIDNGLGGLIDGFGSILPEARLQLSHRLISVTLTPSDLELAFETPSGSIRIQANRAAFCLPPRLLPQHVSFDPALPGEVVDTMQRVPTWMAGHAKFIAIYPEPFWREAGLSGDAISHRGPLAEIHDASPQGGSVGALFGFVGVPASHRSMDGDEVKSAALAQLTDLFGPAAKHPIKVLYKDWVQEPFTATPEDRAPLSQHPAYGMPPVLKSLWDGKLLFAGTEVAEVDGGFLEGALEAAEHVPA